MPEVLILTAGYGEGHNAAARGLLAACEELGIEAELADPFTALGAAYDRSRAQYLDVINRFPKLWAAVYRCVDLLPLVEFSLPGLMPVLQSLADLLTEKRPGVVVSVYPAYGYLLAKLYPRRETQPFGFHTIVTDSITINRVWHRCRSDTFLVPNAASAEAMRAQGVSRERIHDLGFPVPPRFARDRPLRRNPGAGEKGRVLYMINAGKSRAPAIVARLLAVPGIHLTVTVGRDEALRARVLEAADGRDLELHGWTTQMPELLMAHHVAIGKAGGAAVQECIAAQTPMIITHVVPGQEEGNARLLCENGCGAIEETPDAIARRVEQLFAADAAEWRQWHANIVRISRPDAALRIARFVTSPSPGQAP